MSYTRTRAVPPGVFASGLGSAGTSALGYRLYDGATGNPNGARITASVFEIGSTSGYLANVTHPDLFSGVILWDDGTTYALETINPIDPIDHAHFTAALKALLMPRGFVVLSGVTNPVSAGVYVEDTLYNNVPTYTNSTLGLTLWYNGAAWILSALAGTNGANYWLGGTINTAAYAAQGGATGTPSASHKGNSILASYQPDMPNLANALTQAQYVAPVIEGTVSSVAPTTTTFTLTGANLSGSDSVYSDAKMYLVFTSGTNRSQRRLITGYVGATKQVVCKAFPNPPAQNDTCWIVS